MCKAADGLHYLYFECPIWKESKVVGLRSAGGLLDTGSTINIITAAYARELGLRIRPILGSTRIVGLGGCSSVMGLAELDLKCPIFGDRKIALRVVSESPRPLLFCHDFSMQYLLHDQRTPVVSANSRPLRLRAGRSYYLNATIPAMPEGEPWTVRPVPGCHIALVEGLTYSNQIVAQVENKMVSDSIIPPHTLIGYASQWNEYEWYESPVVNDGIHSVAAVSITDSLNDDDGSVKIVEELRLQVDPLIGIQWPTHLSSSELDEVKTIVNNHAAAFAHTLRGRPPAAVPPLELAPEDESTIWVKNYARDDKTESTLGKFVDVLVEDDLVERSFSPYNSPLLVAHDSTGKARLVIDYRRINTRLTKLNYPLPLIEDLLIFVSKYKFVTKLDIHSAFHQVPLAENTRQFTAFSTRQHGHLQFTRLPLGLHSSPTYFQFAIESILEGLFGVSCIVYIDDIIIVGTTLIEHNKNLATVLARLIEFGVAAKPSKTAILPMKLEYLGYIFEGNSVKPDPARLAFLPTFEIMSVASLRSFIGLLSSKRVFIQDLARKLIPLHAALKESLSVKSLIYNEDARAAFALLKAELLDVSALVRPDNTKLFTLVPDCSGLCLGVVLAQDQGAVAYFSRLLIPAERRYSNPERECLAVVAGCHHYRQFLIAAPFEVKCDCLAVCYVFANPTSVSRLTKWAIELLEFDFTITHQPGKSVEDADFLSRFNPLIVETEGKVTLRSIMEYVDSMNEISLSAIMARDLTKLSIGELTSLEVAISDSNALSTVQGSPHASTPAPFKLALEKIFGYLSDPCPLVGVQNEWAEANFVNPPLGDIENWIRAAEGLSNCLTVMLLPYWPESTWYSRVTKWPHYILPKMKFSGYSMKAPFKTLLVLVRPMAEVFITAISALERTPSAPVFNYAELDELAEREIRSLGDTFPEFEGKMYERRRGLYYHAGKIAIPPTLRLELFDKAHASPLSCHFSWKKTTERLQHVYWPGLPDMVRKLCQECPTCQAFNPVKRIKWLGGSVIRNIHAPRDMFTADLVGPVFEKGISYTWLNILDVFTRRAWVKPIPSPSAADLIICVRQLFLDGHIPRLFHTDRGSNFISIAFRTFLDKWNVRFIPTGAYHPLGVVEVANRSIFSLAKKFRHENPNLSLNESVDFGTLAYNTSWHSTISTTPYILEHGCPSNYGLGYTRPHHKISVWTTLASIRESSYPRESNPKSALKIGELVLIKSETSTKFEKLYKGPPLLVLETRGVTTRLLNRSSGALLIVSTVRLKRFRPELLRSELSNNIGFASKLLTSNQISPDPTEIEYPVRSILNARKSADGIWYEVDWVGPYPPSWIRSEDSNCAEAIVTYWESLL